MILANKSEPKILLNNIKMLDEIASIDLCGVAFYMNIHQSINIIDYTEHNNIKRGMI